MSKTGIIVVAHGSRGERGKLDVEDALRQIAAGLRPLLAPHVEVTFAALQFNQPTLEEAAACLVLKNVDRIVIAPYFLFAGRHITEDIPEIISALKSHYPRTEFILAENLGLDASFTSLMAQRIKWAVPDIVITTNAVSPTSSIEQESMNIIGTLLPPLPGFSAEEITVVKRLVHTSGDPQMVQLIKFSPSAIRFGLGAIVAGGAIVTDVRMVFTGIDKRRAGSFNCPVICALDGADKAADGGTRAETAIRHLGTRLNGAVVAIGNAPTALLALLDLIEQEGIRPALVIGMPVGFVRAAESKSKLMKCNAPYITIEGTRGGSPLAAAAVNALLRLAQDKINQAVSTAR